MGKKQRQRLAEQIASIPADQPRVIVATGRYLGEGFCYGPKCLEV
jgi:hypothetical protein